MHGGIYYSGVRTEIYGQSPIRGLDFVIQTSIESMLSGLDRIHGLGQSD
ncbi:MAG: hypothetical protein AAFY03_03160 [Pseudomonadota bacterium]